jgi:hypothetical protein
VSAAAAAARECARTQSAARRVSKESRLPPPASRRLRRSQRKTQNALAHLPRAPDELFIALDLSTTLYFYSCHSDRATFTQQNKNKEKSTRMSARGAARVTDYFLRLSMFDKNITVLSIQTLEISIQIHKSFLNNSNSTAQLCKQCLCSKSHLFSVIYFKINVKNVPEVQFIIQNG